MTILHAVLAILIAVQVASLILMILGIRRDARTLALINNPAYILLNSGEVRLGPKALIDRYVAEGKGTHHVR